MLLGSSDQQALRAAGRRCAQHPEGRGRASVSSFCLPRSKVSSHPVCSTPSRAHSYKLGHLKTRKDFLANVCAGWSLFLKSMGRKSLFGLSKYTRVHLCAHTWGTVGSRTPRLDPPAAGTFYRRTSVPMTATLDRASFSLHHQATSWARHSPHYTRPCETYYGQQTLVCWNSAVLVIWSINPLFHQG